MTLGRAIVVMLLALGGLNVTSASGQSLMVGGGVDASVQRFSTPAPPNRLDGTAGGLTVLGGLRTGAWVVRVEGSRGGTISDVETTSLAFNDRAFTVRSELAHNRRSVAALGGYARDVTPRIMLAVVGGVSFVTFRRTFTTDAGSQLLVGASTVPPAATTTTQVDRFAAWSAGADIFVRAPRRLRIVAGVRVEPFTFDTEFSAWSVRTLAGVAWVR